MSFASVFAHDPAVAWWAPGRVNIIGDHTDYSQGLALPCAIDRGTTVWAGPRDDGVLRLTSAQMADPPHVLNLAELTPHSSGWSAYLEGCAWLLEQEAVDLPGADIYVESTVPLGAGLASSASLTCAGLQSLLALCDTQWPLDRVAKAAQRVENEFVGAPVGVMDPMVVMHAQAGYALLVDALTLGHEQVPLSLEAASLTMVVFNTQAQHHTAGTGYAQRVSEVAAATSALQVSTLREITDPAELERLDDPLLRRRARHVITENERVRRAVTTLRAGSPRDLGQLLTASHSSLRDDFDVSCPELDAVVDAALGSGAVGARMTGAGFGGSALVLADSSQTDRVTEAVDRAFADHGWGPPQSLKVTTSRAAHRSPNTFDTGAGDRDATH